MSAEQHEMYAENVNEEQNPTDPQLENTTATSPQLHGSKRKRDATEENPTIEGVGQERRASLKRTNVLGQNASFMAVNQSAGPPTAPMAFANVGQPQGGVNGAAPDPTVGLHNLGQQMAVSQPPPQMNFAPEGQMQQMNEAMNNQMNNPYGQISPPPPQQEHMAQPQMQAPQQMQPQQVHQQQPSVGPIHHAHVAPPAPPPKPQVGTEEWHKVRRDNHKEGMYQQANPY